MFACYDSLPSMISTYRPCCHRNWS